jgi:hypothetical protein
MQWRSSASIFSLAVLLSGCAAFSCTPITIDVASKDQRTRMVSEFRGVTNDETGRVSPIEREKFVTEYWVADGQGRSYRVTEEQWRDAQQGQPLAVCR